MVIGVLVVGLVVGYLWLAGHWFGRAVAFVVICGIFAAVAMGMMAGNPALLVIVPCLWVLAWFLARLPWAYWNRRAAEGWQVVG